MNNKFVFFPGIVLALILCFLPDAFCAMQTSGFIDSYFSYDSNSPRNGDRVFTTQAVRHNEFNINLAFIEAKVEKEKSRGRLAVQAGTSVQSNYSTEPRRGNVSGPDLSRHIQEAVAGVKLSERLWVDAGIFFSHLGGESFISRDNPTYTRSMVAEYSPYYQSGAKFSFEASEKNNFQLHVLNGWQNISENNQDKSIGLQWSHNLGANSSFAIGGLVGREVFKRKFVDLVFKHMMSGDWAFMAQLDLGQQDVALKKNRNWYGATMVNRFKLKEGWWLPWRLEYFQDKHQLINTTNTANGMNVYGSSLGLDSELDEGALWRFECKYLESEDAIYPGKNRLQKNDVVYVTSLSFTL